jgi:hypothetical protein
MLPISTISTESQTGELPSRIRVVARGLEMREVNEE